MEEEEDNLKSINRRPRSTHPPGFPIVLSSFIIIISISSSIICITTMTIIMIYMHWCLWWCQEGFADSPNIDSATRGLLTKPAKEKGIDQARKGEGRSYQGTLTRQALNYRPEVQKLKAMSHLLKIIEEHFKSIWQSMRCFLNGHWLCIYWPQFIDQALKKQILWKTIDQTVFRLCIATDSEASTSNIVMNRVFFTVPEFVFNVSFQLASVTMLAHISRIVN